MTVCIAAVCESAKKIVIAADRMLTFPYPTNLEFETEEEKIETLAPSYIALVSGNSAYGTEILKNSRTQLAGATTPEADRVFNIVKSEYASVRMVKIDDTIISSSLGVDYAKFLGKGGTLPAYLQPQSQVYQQLCMFTQQFNLGVEIIVAGIDKSGAHIWVIIHPGTLISLDKLGYGAIGSGGIHATIHLSLSAQTSRKKLFDTLYNVYMAKKASEAAPGVGQVTDMAIVESEGVFRCTEPILEELGKLYLESTKKLSPTYDTLQGVYNEQHKS